MPVFDFKCKRCEHIWDKIVLKESENVVCPNCQSEAVKKLIAAPHVHWRFTEKEIRNPGIPKKFYIKRD